MESFLYAVCDGGGAFVLRDYPQDEFVFNRVQANAAVG